jgi:hypothetical protein
LLNSDGCGAVDNASAVLAAGRHATATEILGAFGALTFLSVEGWQSIADSPPHEKPHVR